jgi:septal ring factor EnvC (AmiA/AmiB activator)
VLSTTLLLVPPLGASEDPADRDERLRSIRGEIGRLQAEMSRLGAREQGVLGALERLAAESRLRSAELRKVAIQLEETEAAIEAGGERLDTLEGEQGTTRGYLDFRLRETYKRGPAQMIRRLARGEKIDDFARGLSYASWLSGRDTRELQGYRQATQALRDQNDALVGKRQELTALQEEGRRTRSRLERSRRERERLLETIPEDRDQRTAAVAELENAARDLTALVGDLEGSPVEPRLDISKFRGLLDPPVQGRISAGFGTVVHPRFKTKVPHPGLDIEADAGTPFHAVFEGRVLFASWLKGYGLTAIVDHGGGLLSVYAHASVLLVEKDEAVLRGQELGRVGDTGSLRGPYLYFEIRKEGQALDPAGWLRDAR